MRGHARTIVAAAALLAAAAAAGAVAAQGLRLSVEDARSGRVLHEEPVTAGAAFVLSYVHSSEGVPVRGTFRVGRDGRLTVTETAFGGFGPGLPALTPGDRWEVRDGLLVRHGDEILDELTLRVSPVARQRLRLPSGRELALPELAGSAPIVIRAR